MENTGQKIYGFYDGDFTFHVAEYSVSCLNYTFRVRIDSSPEKRVLENRANPNRAPAGLKGSRPATPEEEEKWLAHFEYVIPRRDPSHTECLRHLRLHGPTRVGLGEDSDLFVAVHELKCSRPVTKDFKREFMRFVKIEDGVASLTDDGLWLTSLMK